MNEKEMVANILKWGFIKNMVVIICFTILAIVFKKWWIAIFAVLFISDVKYSGKDKKESEDSD